MIVLTALLNLLQNVVEIKLDLINSGLLVLFVKVIFLQLQTCNYQLKAPWCCTV